MAAKDIQAKWNRKYQDEGENQWPAAEVLLQNCHLLPRKGVAVDLACGFGVNAFILAEHGLQAHAWDISSVAINRIKQKATELNLDMTAKVVDLDSKALPVNYFDVIVVAHYLNRELIPDILKSLKDGGLLFYQTFIEQKVNDSGPNNKNFLLQPNELLHIFSDLRILVYREEALVGDKKKGFRDKAMLVGQKN